MAYFEQFINKEKEKNDVNKAAIFGLALICIVGMLFSAQPSGSVSFASEVRINLSGYSSSGIVRAHAYYVEEDSLRAGQRQGAGEPGIIDHATYNVKSVNSPFVVFKYDGQPIVDASNKVVCNPAEVVKADYADPIFGQMQKDDVKCVALYARNPKAGGAPLEIKKWYRPAMFSAELVSSQGNARISPSIGVAYFSPETARPLDMYGMWASFFTSTAAIAYCLPLAIVLALMIAAMIYSGRDPFSLFDITVPRLPQPKKVRMRPATIPYHLATMGKVVEKGARLEERVIRSQILALYRKAGKNKTEIRAIRKELKKMFGRQPFTRFAKAGNSADMIADLRRIANNGKNEKIAQREIDRINRIVEQAVIARNALLEQRAITGTARLGGTPGDSPSANRSGMLQRGIERVGMVLGRPLNFEAGKYWNKDRWYHRMVNRFAFIPFVERGSLVATNWLGSRAGNIRLRRDLMKTLVAETALSARMISPNSDFARKNAWAFKKMGEMMDIRARQREDTYRLGDDIAKENIRALEQAIALEIKKNNGIAYDVLGEKGAGIIAKIYADVEKRMKDSGQTSHWVRNQLIAEALAKHINENNIQFFEPGTGRMLSRAERQMLLERALAHVRKVGEIISSDTGATRLDGRLPDHDLAKDNNKNLDPNLVFKNFLKMTNMLKEYENDWNSGKIPMVMLGHDLARVMGRAVEKLIERRELLDKNGNVVNAGESEQKKLVYVRLLMEQEMIKRKLFNYFHGDRKFEGDQAYPPQLDAKGNQMGGLQKLPSERGFLPMYDAKGNLNKAWLNNVLEELGAEKLRNKMGYTFRGEFASRQYSTGYGAAAQAGGGYLALSERNKIDTIRRFFANESGFSTKSPEGKWNFYGGYENFFDGYKNSVDRMIRLHYTYQALAPIYMGKELDASTYNAWMKRGVLNGDLKKAPWIITADRSVIPIPTEFVKDARGNIIGANARLDKNGFLEVKYSALSGMNISSYAERLINATVLYQVGRREDKEGQPLDADKQKWRPGAPTDKETAILVRQLESMTHQLTKPSIIGMSGAEERKVRNEIAAIESQLEGRIRIAPRSSLAYDSSQNPITRGWQRLSQFGERVHRGGVHNTDERGLEWYAAQAITRTMLNTRQEWYKNNLADLASEPMKDLVETKEERSTLAKGIAMVTSKLALGLEKDKNIVGGYDSNEAIGAYLNENKLGRGNFAKYVIERDGQKFLKIGDKEYASNTTKGELIRSLQGELAANTAAYDKQVKEVRRYQKENDWVDRNLARSAAFFQEHYLIAEQTVMRDPRIAFGTIYGLTPAMIVGYSTGQFVGERPAMWAGWGNLPGEKMIGVLAKPSYYAAMTYGMFTRTFFSKTVGYTTVYHLNPETGEHEHTPGFHAAVQSLFHPTATMDWMTRLMNKPTWRGFKHYRDEFGLSLRDDADSWLGPNIKGPLSFKHYAQGELHKVDEKAYKLLDIDAGVEQRARKPGWSHREEFANWDKQKFADQVGEIKSNIEAMERFKSEVTDKNTKKIIQNQIDNAKEYVDATKDATRIPIIGKMLQQGYYSVENRSGYDINAMGGAHRQFEMVWAYHKNIGKAPTPGMFYTNLEDNNAVQEVFPRVSRIIANSDSQNMRNLRNGLAISDMEGGIGRNFASDALRDVYRRESPLISRLIQVEQERIGFTMLNTPWMMPIAPLWLTAFQLAKKTDWVHDKLASQAWTSDVPRYKDKQYEESKLHNKVIERERELEANRSRWSAEKLSKEQAKLDELKRQEDERSRKEQAKVDQLNAEREQRKQAYEREYSHWESEVARTSRILQSGRTADERAEFELATHMRDEARRNVENESSPYKTNADAYREYREKRVEIARNPKEMSYTCPTHGISLTGSLCPMCYAFLDESGYNKAEGRKKRIYEKAEEWIERKAYQFNNVGKSWLNYQHRFNLASCGIHHIEYERGTTCPMCLNRMVREGELDAQTARSIKDEQKRLARAARKLDGDYASNAQRLKEIEAERERIPHFGGRVSSDQRFGYKPGFDYIRSQVDEVKEMEREFSPDISKGPEERKKKK